MSAGADESYSGADEKEDKIRRSRDEDEPRVVGWQST